MSIYEPDDPPPPYEQHEVISLLDDEVAEPPRMNIDAISATPVNDEEVEEVDRATGFQMQLQDIHLAPYDVTAVGREGALAKKFLQIVEDGDYQVVRLTFFGNLALLDLCTTLEQKAAWTLPVHEFMIKKDTLVLDHVSIPLYFLL
jgi:hypothetical protein